MELARGVGWFALARNKLENLKKSKILARTPTLISGLCASLFRLTVSTSCCDGRLPDPPSTATDCHCIFLLSHFQLPSQTFFSADAFFLVFLDCEGVWLSFNSLDVLTNLVNAKSKGNYPHLFPFGISKELAAEFCG